jgi:hypothetical protein
VSWEAAAATLCKKASQYGVFTIKFTRRLPIDSEQWPEDIGLML